MTLFDLWSLNHLASGAFLGFLLPRWFKSFGWATTLCLLALIAWELFEYFGEEKKWSWVEPWFEGEKWGNRGMDVLVSFVGYYIAYRLLR